MRVACENGLPMAMPAVLGPRTAPRMPPGAAPSAAPRVRAGAVPVGCCGAALACAARVIRTATVDNGTRGDLVSKCALCHILPQH